MGLKSTLTLQLRRLLDSSRSFGTPNYRLRDPVNEPYRLSPESRIYRYTFEPKETKPTKISKSAEPYR
jgi:hypothetical protein